jgi:hypothetical protein
MSKTVDGYEYKLSTAKGKKLMVIVDGKTIHFGADGMEHFRDRTGLLPKYLNHGDKQRTAKIVRKDGSKTANDPSSANYHARRILWAA